MPLSHSFRILAIDDEPAILEDYRRALAPPLQSGEAAQKLRASEHELFGDEAPPVPDIAFDLAVAPGGAEGIEVVQHAVAEGSPFSVVFLDARMPPGPHGLETAAIIRRADPLAYIVVVTAYSDVDPADFARLAPPEDRLYFLTKPFHAGEIRQFARSLSRCWDADRRPGAVGGDADLAAFHALSPREQQVFRHVVLGLANKEIGQVLQLSPRTVENYRAKVMEKMGAASLAELVRKAIRAGIA